MNRSNRKLARHRASMAWELGCRATRDPKLAKKIARLLLALPSLALTTKQLEQLSGM